MSVSSSPITVKTPFDSLTMRAVVYELRQRILGGQVQDIRQPDLSELRLGIRNQGRNWTLALSCDARFARVHLTDQRRPNAPTPPSFCMALRKHCEGAVIRDIRQRDFDRVLEIEIGARTGEADSATVILVAELMGKHSNLILINVEGIVLEAAKRISRKINRFREVLPGVRYEMPPEQSAQIDPFDTDAPAGVLRQVEESGVANEEGLVKWLVAHVNGMSPFLAQSIARETMEDGEPVKERLPHLWQTIFSAAKENAYRPVAVLSGGGIVGAYPFPPAQISGEALQPIEDLNAALDAAYSGAVQRSGVSASVSELRGQIERDIKRLNRQKENAERGIREAERAEQLKQTGELLLANLWQIELGSTSVTVQDYFDPEYPERTLTLDPTLSPQENADAYFRRYRKYRDGEEMAAARLAEADRNLKTLEEVLARLKELEGAETAGVDEVQGLRERLRDAGVLQQRSVDSAEATPGLNTEGHKIRRFTTPEGYEIYLGETATANDYLTTRMAASNDLWLHVRASASAHVIIRSHGRPEAVPRSVLEYAALLCARHSSQKHSTLVPVDYTLKKHVRKPRGAVPGSADYHHETTLHVTP